MCRRMRALREYTGHTQVEVAERLGISQAAYSRLEKGEVEISLSKLIVLSEIYSVPLHEMLQGV
jgi:transcriptional regulator with XRE-family HTH domain